MHEVLFTKGDVQGVEHLSILIDDACNCVLCHPGGNTSKCHAGLSTKEGQLKAVRYLISWEGVPALHKYVDLISPVAKGTQCVYAHYLIDLASQ